MSVGALAREMGDTGVLGGGRIGAAIGVLTEMFSNSDYTNFLTLAGPMVPSGFRHAIGDMVTRGFLDAIVSTGANLTHDVVESLGFRHYQGTFDVDDRKLIRAGYNRIADIFVKESSFEQLDRRGRRLLKKIPLENRRKIAVSELLRLLGLLLTDKNSILYKAAAKKVKGFSPGLLGSDLGFSPWRFLQTDKMGRN